MTNRAGGLYAMFCSTNKSTKKGVVQIYIHTHNRVCLECRTNVQLSKFLANNMELR